MAHQKVVKDSKVLNILLEWKYNLWMKWFINIKYKSTLMIIHYLSITLMFFVNKLLYLLIKLRWKVTIWQHKLKLIFTTIVSQKIAHLTYKYNSDPTAWITKGCMKWKIEKYKLFYKKIWRDHICKECVNYNLGLSHANLWQGGKLSMFTSSQCKKVIKYTTTI